MGLKGLSPGARRQLLHVLTSPPYIRADLIRQFHERHMDLAEVLMDIEADDLLRGRVIEELQRSLS